MNTSIAWKVLHWITTLIGAVYFANWWGLFFTNSFGPFPRSFAFPLLIAATIGTGVFLYRQVTRLKQHGFRVTVLVLVISGALGWLVWPTECDFQESYSEIPNKRCDCIGISFPYASSFLVDGGYYDMCAGWEQPVASSP